MVKLENVIGIIKEYCRNSIDKGEYTIDVVDFNADIIRELEKLEIKTNEQSNS